MYQIKQTIRIKGSLEEVWDFFSSPKNLKKISPPYMGFNIITGGEEKMYPGQIITYRLKAVAGIPLNWITEITHVERMKFFVDEQRFGPYSMWHHEHHFKETEGGVEMTDIVSYVLPLGLLGNFAHAIFVNARLKEIFDYRSKVMGQYFEVLGS
ncbi:MAG: hypothetical protein CVT92_04475 [Bacteroidetes bacterium HGW-Bacteroidetes-1]|jgi:ligand-binding SRPBCC domain-containing protein|nr:MAG: hypothetical protein CVT92_04475 [Bacteroidetes bacterium HGW-Bacteroidetes-1]